MKVFTVGLDQKPSQMEDGGKQQKSDSPPPGYSTTEARIPLPVGPELPRPPMPPHPIIVRKSRGYKGILLVMLSVFLMAVFALILSEMAYNRQRDENFFKLRWAELKHRMGYENDGPFDYYQRAAASIGDKFDRLLSLAKSNEMPSSSPSQPIVPQSLAEIEGADQPPPPVTTASSVASPPTTEPVMEPDSFPLPILPGGFPFPSGAGSSAPSSAASSRSGSSSSSSQASFEIEPPQPIFNSAGLNGALNQIRDARLQFLRNILQKIKQHAEDIGFDGTMQVSIIEVEPQDGDESGVAAGNDVNGNGMSWPPQQRQLVHQQTARAQFPPPPPHFFPHARPLTEDFKNSRSFLDGFGEIHQPQQPNFMQNNQLGGEQEEQQQQTPPRMLFGPWMAQPHDLPPPPPPVMQQQQQQQPANIPDFMDNMRWPRVNNNPFRPQPEMLFFHPIFPQQMSLRFPPPAIPQSAPEWAQPLMAQQQQQNAAAALMGALSRPSAFDRWNAGAAGQPQPQTVHGMFQPREQQQQFPQQQQPMMPPQPQQIQIDFPDIKQQAQQQQPPPPPPPPSTVVSSNSDESGEDKFPVAPPNHHQAAVPPPPPPAQQQQPAPVVAMPLQQMPTLPKWLFENLASNNNPAGSGPPGSQQQQQQLKPAEMVKFPSVTVLGAEQQQQPSRVIGVADNENNRRTTGGGGEGTGGEQAAAVNNAGQALAEEKMDAVVEGSSTALPDDVVEVDAAPQQSEQDNNNNNGGAKENKDNNKEKDAPIKGEEEQQDDVPQQQREQQQQQQLPIAQMAPSKWFPEVPSVFFQVDDPIEQQMPVVHPQQDQAAVEKN